MKKILKILMWLAATVVVVIVLAGVGLKLFLPQETIRTMAIEKGGAAVGRDMNIESIDVSFWGGLGVKLVDVTMGNPKGMEEGDFLQADNIDVKLQILPLISGKYRVDRLIINSPKITMIKKADGTNNYTFATIDKKLPPDIAEDISPEAKTAAAAVTFDQLEIKGGELDYIDDSAKMRIHLVGLDLSTALASPRPNFYQSSGEISVESLLVVPDEPWPLLTVKLDYEAGYDFGERRLDMDRMDLEVNGLEFALRGQGYHPAGSVRGRVSVKSKKIAVADLFNLLPAGQLEVLGDFDLDGDFSLDADLEYDDAREEPLVYAGAAVVTDMRMAKKDMPGELKLKRAVIDFKPDNLRMNIEDGFFDGKPLKGILVVDDFADPVINGELAGKLNLAFAQPFLPPEDEHELAGELDFTTEFSGKVSDYRSMQFSGELDVKDGQYNSKLLPEPVESFALEVYFDNNLTRVNDLTLKTTSGSLSFSGRINNLLPYLMADSTEARQVAPSVDGSLSGQLNLALLNSFLPPAGDPHLTGSVAVDLQLTGKATDMSNFKPRGTLVIRDAVYRDSLLPEPIEHFEAQLVISPDTITVSNMTVEFVSSDVSFSGKLIDPFPYLLPLEIVDRSRVRKPMFLFELSSHRFDADKLFPEAVPGSGVNRASVPADSAPPLILPDINGRGTFEIDTLIYSQVEFTHIVGKVDIRDRKIDCRDIVAKVYNGDISAKTAIDLNDFENPHYVGEFQAKQVEVNDFASRFSKFGGHVFGKIDLDGSYDARGWEPEEFLNSLSMNSTMNMNKGKLITSGDIYSAISGLADKAGESFEREQALKNLITDIVVKDGKVAVDQLSTSLADVGDLELDGYYGFDNSVSYNGSILLSKGLTEKMLSQSGLLGGLAGLLSDKSIERIKLPLTITGTMEKPKLALDYSALTESMGVNLKDEAGSLLEGLFKKKKK